MKRTGSTTRNLEVQVAENYGELSRKAGELVAAELKRKPELVFCASAGGTPTGLYQCLAAEYARQPRLFSQMRVLQIDEWGGLPAGHPATCESDLRTKLIRPLRVAEKRHVGFKTDAVNPGVECARISAWLAANGPIDICILGLGTNGHIALNEPGETLSPGVHVAKLAKSSQKHGMLTDLERKPTHGFTLGIADILKSRMIMLLVSGAHKNEVLKRLLKSEISTSFPASFLQLHSKALVLCDREASA
jgi:galactosamine-6-phosphate isomerase